MDTSQPFHAQSIDDAYKHLEANGSGLSTEEAQKREKIFGKNVIKEEKTSKWKIFFRQFNNFLVYILLIASLISLSIKEYTDFIVIIAIIILNGLIAFWQELKAEISLAALKELTEIQNKVLRDGELKTIPSDELVPGDVLVFHEGEAVTADLRLIDSRGLMIDESSLTGESVPVLKDHSQSFPAESPLFDHDNMLLAGTMVARGTGQGIVVRTGTQTYFATIAEKAQEASPDTPLTLSLRRFVKGYVIFIILLFACLGTIGFFQGRPILELIYILIAGLVSAVPEGLPIVLTLVMVIGALKLSKKNVLVRYLPSVETMGSVTVIASDKTGTITAGKLKIAESFSHDEGKLKRIAALCNDSNQGKGDPIDVALSHWVENYTQLREEFPRKWAYAFDTKLRLMGTKHEIAGQSRFLVKGAYESLKNLTQNMDPKFDEVNQAYLEKGYRVLAFGSGEFTSEDPNTWKIEMVGLVGFIDPPKDGVDLAVQFARQAGIRVAMITGDHPLTAKQISKEVGIYSENDPVLTGQEIETQPENQMLDAVKKATVFARIVPEHKYKIVKMLQKDDEIVAVTGDGVNDVPALKAANIGIAMGGGTEAAKSVSKMILTDNNLKVIVEAIKNARIIADNMRKVIYYLMATSLQELIIISLSIFFSVPIPLTAIQILWINIVTDGVQDKFFAFAKEEGDVMKRKPRDPDKLFFDVSQVSRALLFGIPMGIIVFFIYLYMKPYYPFETLSTVAFTSIVFAQWANGIQAQKETAPFFMNIKESFTINPLVYLGLGFGIILQVAAIMGFPEIFRSTRLSFDLWKIPILMFIIAFLWVEIRKWIALGIQRFRSGK